MTKFYTCDEIASFFQNQINDYLKLLAKFRGLTKMKIYKISIANVLQGASIEIVGTNQPKSKIFVVWNFLPQSMMERESAVVKIYFIFLERKKIRGPGPEFSTPTEVPQPAAQHRHSAYDITEYGIYRGVTALGVTLNWP